MVFGTGVAYYFLKIVYWEVSAYTTCFFKREITLYMCHAPLLGGKKIAHTCCLEGAKKEHIYVSGRGNFGRPALFLSFNLPKPTHDFAVTVPKK